MIKNKSNPSFEKTFFSFQSSNTTNPNTYLKRTNSSTNMLYNMNLFKKKLRDSNYTNNNLTITNFIKIKNNILKYKNTLKARNRMTSFNEMFKSQKKNSFKKIKSNSLDDTDYSLNEKPINKVKYFLPILQKKNLNNSDITDETMKTIVKHSKMSFDINELLYVGISEDKNELMKNCQKYYLIQILRKYQKERLETSKKNDLKKVKNKNIRFQKLLNSFIQKLKNYDENMRNYLKFLERQKNDEIYKLEKLNEDQYNAQIIVDNLLLNIVNTQLNLEKLIDIRNFLLMVKLKISKLPKELLNEINNATNRDNIIKKIKSLNIKININTVHKFISQNELNTESYKKNSSFTLNPSKKEEKKIKFMQTKNKFSSKRMNTLKSENINDNVLLQKINPYIKDKIPIFNSPEEFIDIINDLENKNLDLLKENEKINRNKEELRSELEIINNDVEKYGIIIDEIINKKNTKYQDLIKRNKTLNDIYQSIIINNNDNEENKKKYINKPSFGIFIDMEQVNVEKYNIIKKNYKYDYTLLLNKLIDFITTFLKSNYKNYTRQRVYNLVNKDLFNNIIKNKNIFSNEIKYFIYDYCVILLKIYENIIEYVLENNKILSQNKYNLSFMTQLSDKYLQNKKNENSKEIREFIDKKRNEEIKIIIEKSKKNYYPLNRRVLEFRTDSQIKKNQQMKKNELKKGNDEEKYNQMILFSKE